MSKDRRNLAALSSNEYDLVIVGGGIFGVCVAWDGALRGLRVALLEQEDFAHGASANCFKMVHGGIRYLQHGDLVRMWGSSRERSTWLRIAPHQVKPLPIVIPTFGLGMQGKAILASGAKLYDFLTLGRNRGIFDPERCIPPSSTLDRDQTLELFPGVEREGLSGAVVFHDAQMHSPARLALAVLRSALEAGAHAANYAEVTGFVREGTWVRGVRLQDRIGGGAFEVRGRIVLNATGGWAPRLLDAGLGRGLRPAPSFSRDACFIVRRRVSERHALAVPGQTRDPDALVHRSARHLFLVPWRDHTLVGVWHVVWQGDPDRAVVSEEDLEGFLAEINTSYPALALKRDDVVLTQAGLVLFGENRPGATDLSYGKRSRLVDHARTDGIDGLITLLGVRYTTARADAAQAVDVVCARLGRALPRADTENTPVWGGRIERFDELLRHAQARRPTSLGAPVMEGLARAYGSEYPRVLNLLEEDPGWGDALGASTTLAAEVIWAVREEMAQHLADVVFRRTDLGTAGDPGDAALETAADCMARELGWDAKRRGDELERVRAGFPS